MKDDMKRKESEISEGHPNQKQFLSKKGVIKMEEVSESWAWMSGFHKETNSLFHLKQDKRNGGSVNT